VTDGVTEGQHEPLRPRIVLLGSDELSRELAIALRHLGAEVIAVDDHPDAPAHSVADQSLVLPMTDDGEVSALIKRLQPDFVVTAADAVSVDALESLAADHDHELTELVPNARTVRLTSDREALRRLAADELGLPTAPFWFVGSLGDLKAVAAHAGSQLLVEPAAGPVGDRRSVVRGPGDLETAWERAVGSAPPERQRVLAETVVEVEFYVTLLAIRSEGPKGPVIEFCSPIGHRGVQGDVQESWQPQHLTPAATDAAKSIAARIVKALGGRGVFSVELMVNGDEVYFASISARLPQTAWVTLRSQRLSAFELQARAILGLPVDTLMISPAAARAINRGRDGDRAPAAGSLSADALAGALGVPETDLRVFGRGSTRQLGVALAMGPDVAAARDRARDAAAALSGAATTDSQRPS
jgi:phosphoribosylglycinamide formyltransferase 2